jgi:predicted homoserine dehydrogenase-like protein
VDGSYFGYLSQRSAAGSPIRIGLVGVGQMGAGIVAQSTHVPGIRLSAVADVQVDRALTALARIGQKQPVVTDDLEEAHAAIEAGKTVVSSRADVVARVPVDVVVEATGIPEVGARVGLAAGLAGRDLVSMNVEADVTVGRLLRRIFELTGGVYTLAAGDEPSCAYELVDFARTVGFDVVTAGKGKNNPLRQEATPDSVREEAERKRMNPKMLAAFVDGSKTMVEMTALANATGFPPDVPGMHGPAADAADLPNVFRPTEEGGILSRTGVVDYVTGDVAPGVFVVFRVEDAEVAADLDYLKLGPGPYWALIRPYHLANLEVPVSIVKAVRDRSPTLVPAGHVAEVAAVAKRGLEPGHVVGGIGSEDTYGVSWPAEQSTKERLLPLGLAEHAVVQKPVVAKTPITLDDVDLDDSKLLVALWRLQERTGDLGRVELEDVRHLGEQAIG